MKKPAKITFLWQRILMTVVFITGALGVLFNKDQSAKSEYLFICTQSAYFLIISFVPTFLKKLELDIPDYIYIIFIFFCLAHYFCGEILGFYVKIWWWDSFLHTFSGMMMALLSFSLINLLNNNSKDFKLSIGFMALFAFSLTLTIGVIWEIFEFANDSISGSNMQRAYVSTMNGRGEPLLGQAALADTMKDLILDSIGAGIVCIICVIAVCKNKIKVEDLSIIKKKKKTEQKTISNTSAQQEQLETITPAQDAIVIDNFTSNSQDELSNDSNVDENIKDLTETEKAEPPMETVKETPSKKTTKQKQQTKKLEKNRTKIKNK